MKAVGKVARVMPIQSGVSARGTNWASQEFVLQYKETEGQFETDSVLLKLFGQERIDKYNLQVGDPLEVYFEHHVKDYKERLFNELKIIQLRKIEREVQSEQVQQMYASCEHPAELPKQETQEQVEEKESDLPF